MGSPSVPRKERNFKEDEALALMIEEAEAQLSAKRKARAEAREKNLRKLERQQKEVEKEQNKWSLQKDTGDFEERYLEAVKSVKQLERERQLLLYTVEALKESLEAMEEELNEAMRKCKV
ncbi:leucine-rich repeat flightless-interacting protein 2-like [Latimeria chalumnae]|uniref:leucine-rich repeat flightless-interacting protein 2-like n=1 Tax=Latimeria chalumnae TaxID=7897 RepID=UPI0003C19C05|nr:PREDICTED: leucine-rich repeat flightless-interacting protein 2-like [Latimeria chalumnae]|eukprot:XP_005986285.1 PREDICTED: leucine-rich repeat flightless-interacting protein 2-like [Latimeria chalumnae]